MNTTEAILWLAALAIGMGLVFWFSRDNPTLTFRYEKTVEVSPEATREVNASLVGRLDQLYRELWDTDDPDERRAIYDEIKAAQELLWSPRD